jgi:hypothetical protein
MFCLAWPRPLVVGGVLRAFAVLLEGLQAFMPDRSSYYVAALYSAGGVLASALLAELFIRVQRRFQSWKHLIFVAHFRQPTQNYLKNEVADGYPLRIKIATKVCSRSLFLAGTVASV